MIGFLEYIYIYLIRIIIVMDLERGGLFDLLKYYYLKILFFNFQSYICIQLIK